MSRLICPLRRLKRCARMSGQYSASSRWLQTSGSNHLPRKGPSDGVEETVQHRTQRPRALLKESVKDVEFRLARPSDKEEVLAIEPNVHEGLDYLSAHFDSYLKDPNRRVLVAVKEGKIVAIGVCHVVDNGTTAALSAGRTLLQYRQTGIISALGYVAVDTALKDFPNLRRSTGVYQLPIWSKEYLRSERFTTGKNRWILQRKADGFEVKPGEVKPLLGRLKKLDSSAGEGPVRIPGKDIWEHLKSGDSKSRIFPENEMLIGSETFRPMKETFEQIKNTKAKDVFMTFDDANRGQGNGISFRNSYPVPFGYLYKIDIFCENDHEVFDHFVTQVTDGLQTQEPAYKELNIMLTVFFPFSTDKEEFLAKCKEKLQLIPSNNAKVGLDVTVVEFGFVADSLKMTPSWWEKPAANSKL